MSGGMGFALGGVFGLFMASVRLLNTPYPQPQSYILTQGDGRCPTTPP